MERLKPSEHKEFERLIRDFIAWEYPKYDHFTLYGKNGERQYGCDVLNQERTLIVQCKCLDNSIKGSHDNLISEIKKNYEEACNHFPSMQRFVVCTTLDVKQTTQDRLKELEKQIPIDIWFWDEIEQLNGGILTINRKYAEEFEKPLFLHKNNPAVCLKNLFVLQNYREIRPYSQERDHNNKLWKRIGQFVEASKPQLLIIEGDAGCGKTSLVQSLCWHDREGDKIAELVLKHYPLLTVRLRDLDKKRIVDNEGLLPAIMDDLGIATNLRHEDRKEQLLRRFPRAVLILDGFDELCIIEGLHNNDYEDLLYQLLRERLDNWRFIVTSRPNYIHRDINVFNDILELQHFDIECREKWIKQYTDVNRCGQKLDEALKKYLRDSEADVICDAPLTLYLAAGGNVGPKEQSNLWRLYRRLFYDELSERQYDTSDHPGAKYREEAYRLAEAISYQMYLSRNTQLWIRDDMLEELAKNLVSSSSESSHDKELRARALTERCTALCCYWKAQTDRGAVEFYHNNIRDFFLCEKIYDNLDAIYQDRTLDAEKKKQAIITFFRDSFRITKLENRVVDFLYLRALWEREQGKQSFPTLERKEKLLPGLFQQFLSDGTVYDGLNEKHLIRAITAILSCITQVYQAVLAPFHEREMLSWWIDVQEVNDAGLLRSVFTDVICEITDDLPLVCTWPSYGILSGLDLSRKDLTAANLHSTNLRNANFQLSNLHGANLQNGVLMGANLRGAFLFGTKMTGANMVAANLQEAKMPAAIMKDVCLTEANLKEADLFNADMQDAVLTKADLRNADLHSVNAQNACLQFADLRGANLYGANMQHANLYGANSRDVDMHNANLRGANFQDADLYGANLQDANLYGANLQDADLHNVNLRGANLQEANLYGTNLYGANLDGANVYNTDLHRANMLDADLQNVMLLNVDLQDK